MTAKGIGTSIRAFIEKCKTFFHGNVTVEVWDPINFSNDPEPQPFMLRGKILRVDAEPRRIGKRGSSFTVSIDPSWIPHLPEEVIGHFFQTPRFRGIIFIGEQHQLSGGE